MSKNRNTLIKYAMLMAMDLCSFCLDNDVQEDDQVINRGNRDYFIELFEKVLKAIPLETNYLKKIKKFDITDIGRCDDLMDYIQYSYPKVISTLFMDYLPYSLEDICREISICEQEQHTINNLGKEIQ